MTRMITAVAIEDFSKKERDLELLLGALWDNAKLDYTKENLDCNFREVYKILKYMYPEKWHAKMLDLKGELTVENPL